MSRPIQYSSFCMLIRTIKTIINDRVYATDLLVSYWLTAMLEQY